MFQRLRKYIYFLQYAIKGTNEDLTNIKISRAIILLSIPMVLEMVMESLFAVVDVFFVSQISTNAVATVGLTESVITIVYSLGIGLSMAATAMVARRIGEKKPKEASFTAIQSILLTLAISLVLSVGGFIFAEDILRLMGGEADLIAEGKWYTKILFASSGSIMLLFLINGIFRGAGNAAIAMRALWISNILNMLLDPLFIFGWGFIPEMGVAGAAVATTIGRSTGVMYQLYHLLKGTGIIRISLNQLKPDFSIIIRLIKIASGGVGQFLIESASWIFLTRIISQFGSEALAGYTIALRIIIFTILPSFGISNAAATLVGQNLGAKLPERAEKSVWLAARYNVIFLFSVSLIFYIFAHEIVGIFTDVASVKAEAIKAIRYICFGYIFFAYGMVVSHAFNGAGDTKTPTIINFICFWVIQIPLSYYLATNLGWETDGVYAAIITAFSLLAIISIIWFRKGRWKLKEV
ncbi:MATE family efflux transporter [Marivirga sp. S37H4]|uniref:Multidrug-efflux transporter n=1 Tax=Marivirga aurantiaca TaxID=2802615 RepID=A0A934X0U1_9BACT|nr:MATE family efflux transporter [Marivirga aurantiaca]MBK6266819.1 MATE family efflux transporter [Marivirga aurantiaca]